MEAVAEPFKCSRSVHVAVSGASRAVASFAVSGRPPTPNPSGRENPRLPREGIRGLPPLLPSKPLPETLGVGRGSRVP